ncbi:hypothetical protein [Candidatus Coxiella mudrowiae]|uniref:hypothetical protein n=1 Tax=Candidatus Coxiella mudrowiae TaxID=2054173 RepID=UPI0006623413|nr:hypothetical protein [Candidatus Coxiella mudrowiae]
MLNCYQNCVVLVGNACQCLTLMAGQGASMAMAGGYTLLTMLHQNRSNYQRAFRTYYQKLLKPPI